jgi:hypothetical protein
VNVEDGGDQGVQQAVREAKRLKELGKSVDEVNFSAGNSQQSRRETFGSELETKACFRYPGT